MDNYRKTKAQLVHELNELQQRIAALEAAEAAHQLQTATLAASQRKVEALVNSIEGIVWELDLAAKRFTFVSQQAERLLGYPIERWLCEANFWLEHIHPDDRAWVTELNAKETQARRGYELEYRMVSGEATAGLG